MADNSMIDNKEQDDKNQSYIKYEYINIKNSQNYLQSKVEYAYINTFYSHVQNNYYTYINTCLAYNYISLKYSEVMHVISSFLDCKKYIYKNNLFDKAYLDKIESHSNNLKNVMLKCKELDIPANVEYSDTHNLIDVFMSYDSHLKTCEQDNSNKESIIKTLSFNVESLEEEINQINEDHQNELIENKKEYDKLMQQKDHEYLVKLKEYDSKMDELMHTVEMTKIEATKYKQEATETLDRLQKIQNESMDEISILKESHRKEMLNVKQKLEQKETSINESIIDRSQYNMDLKEYQKEIESLKEKMVESNKNYDKLKTKYENLKKNCSNCDKYKELVAKMNKDIDNYKSKLGKLTKIVDMMRKK